MTAMRSRASDAQMSNNTRSRSVDRVSNSSLDLSRLSRSITDTTSTRFNSLNRVRGSQKSSMEGSMKKQGLTGSNNSICSTLPTRGRFNNARPGSKYNFKADPCFTSNIDHLVYANSTRSSFNVKYGGNFPLNKAMERRLEENKKLLQQKVGNKSGLREPLTRQQTSAAVNKAKSSLNTSSGGSKSFDNNVFQAQQRSTSPSVLKTSSMRQQSGQQLNNRASNVPRVNKTLQPSNVSPSAAVPNNARSNNGANKYAATKQQTCYVNKQHSSEGSKPNNNSVTRNRLEAQQCNKYEDTSPTMLHSNNKVASTTTTILQETTPNRRNNVSILQVRSVSEPNSAQPQTTITKHQIINNAALQAARVNSARNNTLLLPPQSRSSAIPVYRSQSNAANLWKSAAGKIVTCAAKSKSEAAKNATTAAREMSPVRWCDQEVQGVYLGRSGWVQVYQQNNRPITKAKSTENETQQQLHGLSSRISRPESLNLTAIVGNNEVTKIPPPPQQYSRSVSAPVDPGPTILLSDDEQMMSLHTPIISPPLAFQDDRESKPLRNKLPRSNAFDFPDPDEVTKIFMQQAEGRDKSSFMQQAETRERFSPTKKQTSPSKLGGKTKVSSEESSGSSTGSFRTAASSGGMRSVTPSWRGGSGGGGRHSCESCSSESSRHRSSSEESLSFLNLSPEHTPKSTRHKHVPHQRYSARNNGVLHLSDSNTPARKHNNGGDVTRRTVTSPESSTSSASSSPVRPVRGNRLEIPPRTMNRAHSSAARSNYGPRLSPQCDTTYQHVKRSTSLQLPSHADYPPAINYRQHKPAASQETTNYQRPRTSGKGKEEGLGWHQAELRAVTDYLSSTRSRTAARALLLQRYLNQQGISPNMENHELTSELMDDGRHSSASFNVVYVQEKPPQRPQEKIYADRESLKSYADRDSIKNYGERDSVKNYGERDSVKNYGERDNVKNYGERDSVKNYGERDSVKNYGERDSVKNYGERDSVKNYGERENIKTYADRDVKTYGDRESIKTYSEREKSRVEREKSRVERDKTRVERDKTRVEREKPRVERENIKTRVPWQRGSSAPLNTLLDSDEEFQRNRHQTKVRQNNTKYQQCCNPATCDFWPECEHQITSPQSTRKPYLCQIRPSLSYPSPCNDVVPYQRSNAPATTRIRDRSITAPCSLDRVDEDTPPSHVITIPKRDIHVKRDDSPVEKNGFRNSSSDDLSTSADDLDEKWVTPAIKTPQPSRKSPSGSASKQLISDSEESPRNPKTSPKTEENPNLLSTGRPHSADCLLRRRQYSTTVLKAQSERNSPIVEETPRKTAEDADDSKGAQQRSLSLPKSFLSNRQPPRPKIGGAWQNSNEDSEDGLLRVPYPGSALSTPSTPGHVSHKPDTSNDKSCFGSSTPKDRISPGSGSATNFLTSALRHAGLTTKQRRNSSELSVLQKFKKSFTQRFARSKGRRDTMSDCAPATPLTPDTADEADDSPLIQDLLMHQAQLDTDAYFKRIGPVWRQKEPSSNGNKSCRNSKCSSGDSGFQVEEALKSLETEMEAQEASPEVSRRIKSPSENKKSRPLSEVLTETFLDKYKLEGEEVKDSRQPVVRRTHSDLGSPLHLDPLRMRSVFKRQISSPSPLKMRPVSNMGGSNDHGLNSASEDDLESNVVLRRTSAASTDSNVSILSATPIQRQQQLRRSISQPMGMNELSPLLRRRPSGIPSVIPRRVTQRRRVRGRRRGKGACSEDDQRNAASSDYDEDDETDSECSSTSSLSRKHAYDIRPLTQVVLAEAVWDHVTMDTEELAFKAGELIEVVDCTSDKDWWFGQIADKKGWFPAAFVRFRVSQEDTVEDCLASMSANKAPSPCEKSQIEATSPDKSVVTPGSSKKHSRTRSSVSLMSNDQVRASVVREIINTERDFVRNLTDVVEGYLWECRRREDLFTSQQLMNIFGNIEELLEFQTHFLSNLETKVLVENPIQSCLGQTFLSHSSGFHIYSEYCNGHPIAQATLQELYAQAGYKQFFEACRLVRGLINISLDGFLLTPVQRICKYPLQLGELLKYTRSDHPDYEDVRAALEAMRSVATLVNERKRRMESLEKLSAWQQRVEGWEGEDLIDLSSQLIHQGEAVRVTSGRWSSNVKLFLFDRQLLYCKRDLLRRGLFVYKGRIALDHCTVMDVPDGKDIHLGISVRHGIKLVSRSGPSGRPPVSRGAVQWLLLCFRSADEKIAWLHALGEERHIVQSEQARGLQLEPSARELARLLTNRQNTRPTIKPNAKSYSKRRSRQQTLVPHLASSETSLGSSCQSFSDQGQHSLGRKVGHWFTFSSSKKQHRRSPPVNRGGSLQQLLPQ